MPNTADSSIFYYYFFRALAKMQFYIMAPTERVENNAPQPGNPLNALKLHKWKKGLVYFHVIFLWLLRCFRGLEYYTNKKKMQGNCKKIRERILISTQKRGLYRKGHYYGLTKPFWL